MGEAERLPLRVGQLRYCHIALARLEGAERVPLELEAIVLARQTIKIVAAEIDSIAEAQVQLMLRCRRSGRGRYLLKEGVVVGPALEQQQPVFLRHQAKLRLAQGDANRLCFAQDATGVASWQGHIVIH